MLLDLPGNGQLSKAQTNQFGNNQKQVISGCKFLKEWLAKYRCSQGGEAAD